MDLLHFCERPLAFDSNEKLSKVISNMYSEKKHEAFIYSGSDFLGILSAADLVTRNITDPEGVKVGGLSSLIRKTKVFSIDSDPKELITAMLMNSFRSVPVDVNGELYSISKLSLLRCVQKDLPAGKCAEDVMFFPDCSSSTDTVAVAKSVLRQSHVYRMVILNKQNKVEGVIDELDLLRLFISKLRPKKGEIIAEKIRDNIQISSHMLMRDSFISVSPLTELKYVVEAMVKNNNDTVVVSEDGKLLGIITPREMLKLVGSDIGGVYVRISGIQNEDAFLQSVVDSEIRSVVRKLGKILNIQYLTLNVKKEKVPGKLAAKKVNYIVRGKLVSNKGLFVSDYDAWDLRRATKGSLQKLEKEVLKKVGKERVFGRFQKRMLNDE